MVAAGVSALLGSQWARRHAPLRLPPGRRRASWSSRSRCTGRTVPVSSSSPRSRVPLAAFVHDWVLYYPTISTDIQIVRLVAMGVLGGGHRGRRFAAPLPVAAADRRAGRVPRLTTGSGSALATSRSPTDGADAAGVRRRLVRRAGRRLPARRRRLGFGQELAWPCPCRARSRAISRRRSTATSAWPASTRESRTAARSPVTSASSSRIPGRSWSWSASRTTSRSGSRIAPGRRMPCGSEFAEPSPRLASGVLSAGDPAVCREGSSSGSRSPASWPPRPEILVLDEPTANLDPAGGCRASSTASRALASGAVDHDRAHRASRRRTLGRLPTSSWRLVRDGAPIDVGSARRGPRSLGGADVRRRVSGCPRALARRMRPADLVSRSPPVTSSAARSVVAASRVGVRIRTRCASPRRDVDLASGAGERVALVGAERQRQVDPWPDPGRPPAAAPWSHPIERRRPGRAAGTRPRPASRLCLPGPGGRLPHEHRPRRGDARARTRRNEPRRRR